MVGKRILASLPRISISGRFVRGNANPSTTFPASSSSTLVAFVPPPPPLPPLAPGDMPAHTPGHKVSPEEVRELHELIRRRYELDVWLWGKRVCYPGDREHVETEMVRSDATLVRIISLVRSWDRRDAWDSEADWAKLKEIRRRLEEGGKRHWAAHPPWARE